MGKQRKIGATYTYHHGLAWSDVVAGVETSGPVGGYQAALIRGVEAWSGATLKGKAREWGGVYARSRDALVARIRACGYRAEYKREDHGRIVLHISRD